eukprot:TRINITY_DN74544_c0_g1_i2.p1 TRINITY_DN74544_c0_g1~~TRINITY_DN74544_c0_g1_i2.p1  ORF type:complete len:531 (+),score=114.51 TRINITY_DN74544_c0_g1_i2:139-1731(+)
MTRGPRTVRRDVEEARCIETVLRSPACAGTDTYQNGFIVGAGRTPSLQPVQTPRQDSVSVTRSDATWMGERSDVKIGGPHILELQESGRPGRLRDDVLAVRQGGIDNQFVGPTGGWTDIAYHTRERGDSDHALQWLHLEVRRFAGELDEARAAQSCATQARECMASELRQRSVASARVIEELKASGKFTQDALQEKRQELHESMRREGLLRDELASLQGREEKLAEAYDSIKVLEQKLLDQRSEFEKYHEGMDQQLEAAKSTITKLEMKLVDCEDQHQRSIVGMKQQLEEAQRNASNLDVKLKHVEEQHQRDLAAAEKKYQDAVERARQAELECATQQCAVEARQKVVVAREDEIRSAHSEVNQLLAERDYLRDSVSEAVAKSAASHRECDSLRAMAANFQADADEAHFSMKRAMEDLQIKLAEVERKSALGMERLEADLRSTRSDLAAARNHAEGLHRAHADEAMRWSQKSLQHETDKEAVSARCKRAEAAAEQLRAELSETRAELSTALGEAEVRRRQLAARVMLAPP